MRLTKVRRQYINLLLDSWLSNGVDDYEDMLAALYLKGLGHKPLKDWPTWKLLNELRDIFAIDVETWGVIKAESDKSLKARLMKETPPDWCERFL